MKRTIKSIMLACIFANFAIFAQCPYTTVDEVGNLVKIPSGEGDGNYTTQNAPRGVAFTPSGLFVGTANQLSDSITMFSVDLTTGILTLVGSFTTGPQPYAIAFSPNGLFVATANFGDGTVKVFAVDPATGQLTSIVDEYNNDISIANTGTNPVDLSYSPNGFYLTVVNNGSNNLSVFSVDQVTGQLTPLVDQYGNDLSTVPVGNSPAALAYHPLGEQLSVVNSLDNTLSLFNVNTNTGGLEFNSNFATGATPSDVDYSCSGAMLGVTNQSADTVRIYSVAAGTGLLTEIGDFTAGTAPVALSFATNELFLAITNNSGSVTMYQVNVTLQIVAKKSSTFPNGNFPVGTTPFAGVFSPDSEYFIVANTGDSDLTMFRVLNDICGTIEKISPPYSIDFPTDSTGPKAATFSPTLSFIGIANTTDVSMYSMNGNTGFITKIPNPADVSGNYPAGNSPRFVAFAPNGRFVIFSSQSPSSNHLNLFSLDKATGILSPTPIQTLDGGSVAAEEVKYSPNGRFVAFGYSAISSDVTMCTVDNATGFLTKVIGPTGSGNFTSGQTDTRGVSFSPDGHFLAVANSVDDTVSLFSVDQETGFLTNIQVISTGTPTQRPVTSAYSCDGQFLAVANSTGNNIGMFSVDPTTGMLTFINNFSTGLGFNPESIAFHPSGRFVVVVAPTAGMNVKVFSIDLTTGTLTLVEQDLAGATALGLALNCNCGGRFMGVSNRGADTISMFEFTGGITQGDAPFSQFVEPGSFLAWQVRANIPAQDIRVS